MRFGIAKRVAVAFGTLLFLFFITSAVAYLLSTRIKQGIEFLTDASNLHPESLYAIHGTLLSTIVTLRGQSDSSESATAWVRSFDKASASFDRSAAARLDAGAGGTFRAGLNEFKQLGLRLSDLAVEQRAALALLQAANAEASRRIAEYIENGGMAGEAEPLRRREAARELEVWLQQLTNDATVHAINPGLDYAATDAEKRRAFEALASLYASAATPDAGRAWFQAVAVEVERFDAATAQVRTISDERVKLFGRLDRTVAHINARLNSDLLPVILDIRSLARRSVDNATSQLIIYLCVMTAFGGLMGASTALVLIRGIIRPIVQLTEGARTIGGGQLDYRIPIDGDDEFGKLANSINRMAERRQRSEEALRQAANQDSLTRLPNRVVFQDRLVEALSSAGRIERMVAVLLLDLDHFKDVNDTLGHPSGDALLKQVAERLLECVRKSDTVSRLGGDEFGIIQTNLNSETGVEVLARRIINSLARPFEIDGEQVYTGTSIGITVFPHDDREADKLIKNADLALYRAKQDGRNKYQLYDAEMNAEVQERKALELDLRQALVAGDLFLNFQPKMDVESGLITGAEALVRWYSEERGMVSPGLFIPVAEDTGMITSITDMVLRKVCMQIREWQDRGLPVPRISLNLSAADFKRENLIDVVKHAYEDAGVDPKFLELEITEGMAMGMNEHVNEMLIEMRELGMRIAIDDFGTGYSSMAYLTRFPIDALKIDQTFVRKIITESDSANITSAIIHLAQSLHVDVVAEGVEEEAQYQFLRERGCDEIQGYWISRPLHAAGFMEFLTKFNSDAAPASVRA